MGTKKFIAGVSVFAMIFGLGINHTSADETTTFVYGDVDGDGIPQINDLTKMSLNLLGDFTFDDNQKKAADVNTDNDFNIADLATMKQYVMHDDIQLGKSLGTVTDVNGFDVSKCQLKSQIMLSNPLYNIFSKGNGAQLSMVIDSENKFEELKQLWPENNSETFEKFGSDLDLSEDFYKDNTLFIIAMIEGSTSSDTKITDIKLSEEKGISFEVNSSLGESKTNMSYTWLHAAVIPNQYLDGIDRSKIRIINTGSATENDGILNYLDISACDVLNYKTSDYFDFLQTDNKDFINTAVIKSEEDFIKYNKQFNDSADKLNSYFGMSEEFFKDNTLFIIPVNENSGSIKDEITYVGTYVPMVDIDPDSITDGSQIAIPKQRLTIQVTSSVPPCGECDMATWHLAVAIPNRFIKDVDMSDLNIMRVVKKEKEIPENDVLDLTDCEKISLPTPYDNRNSGFHSSLITSTEELYKYNNYIRLISDLIKPQLDNYADLLKDNVMIAINDIGHSGTINKYVSGISVDENNKITLDFTTCDPSSTHTADYRQTNICLLVPRRYFSESSEKPELEIIQHEVKEY